MYVNINVYTCVGRMMNVGIFITNQYQELKCRYMEQLTEIKSSNTNCGTSGGAVSQQTLAVMICVNIAFLDV